MITRKDKRYLANLLTSPRGGGVGIRMLHLAEEPFTEYLKRKCCYFVLRAIHVFGEAFSSLRLNDHSEGSSGRPKFPANNRMVLFLTTNRNRNQHVMSSICRSLLIFVLSLIQSGATDAQSILHATAEITLGRRIDCFGAWFGITTRAP